MGFKPLAFPLEKDGLWCSLVVAVVLGGASLAMADDDPLGDPAMATSTDPSSITVGTQDPSSLTVGTQDPGALTVPTTALPAPVEPASPGRLVVPTESLSSLKGKTWGLEDLPEAATVESEVRRKVASQVAESQHRVPPPDSLATARSQLAASEARLDRIDSAIGTMLERDYPTGEARLRLYDEQSEARAEVEDSKEWVKRFDQDGAGFSE